MKSHMPDDGELVDLIPRIALPASCNGPCSSTTPCASTGLRRRRRRAPDNLSKNDSTNRFSPAGRPWPAGLPGLNHARQDNCQFATSFSKPGCREDKNAPTSGGPTGHPMPNTPRPLLKNSTALVPDEAPAANEASPERPFRFYDNRQKYLAFVNSCNEKWKVAERVAAELEHLRPTPPALRVFDAGMGDGTVISHVMRAMHQRFPTLPFYVVGKEISLEDIRLSLEKLPDRFVEHPASVMVLTNLYYVEAPWLTPRAPDKAAALNWRVVELEGNCAYEYGQQLGSLDDFLIDAWQATASPKTGNPLYVRPTVMVVYRKDHKFLLNSVIPRPDEGTADYDLVIASQPWRARMNAQFKVKNVLAPLVRSLAPTGRMLAAQSFGEDPGLEIIREIWPAEDPFQVDRHELLNTLKRWLKDEAHRYRFDAGSFLSINSNSVVIWNKFGDIGH